MGKLRIICLLTVMMLVIALAGCGKQTAGAQPGGESAGDPEPVTVTDGLGYEQVTYLVCTGYPASYIVYVITPDMITEYNFTEYWMNHRYNYFESEMPDESDYSSKSYALSSEGLDTLTESLVENKFEKLPEDLSVDDIYDGPCYDIEVLTADGSHRSGGYCAGLGSGWNAFRHERYHNVIITLHEVIKEATEDAKDQ